MSSPKTKPHLELPNGSYMLCHSYFNYGVREENEITRHYRIDHPDQPQWHTRGQTPYQQCRIVPARVADALVNEEKNLRGRNNYDGVNGKPKSSPATVQKMRQMFVYRGLAVPVWLAGVQPVQITDALGVNAMLASSNDYDDSDGADDEMDIDEDEHDIEEDGTDEPESEAEDEDHKLVDNAIDDDDDEDESMVDFRLPAIAQQARTRPHTIETYDPDQPTFTCHVCPTEHDDERVFGNLYDMFCHYNASHPEHLHARFARMYTGRYLRKLAETTAGDDEALAMQTANRAIGPRAPDIQGGTDEHLLETMAGKCHICMLSEAEEPGRSFWDLDGHLCRSTMMRGGILPRSFWETGRMISRIEAVGLL